MFSLIIVIKTKSLHTHIHKHTHRYKKYKKKIYVFIYLFIHFLNKPWIKWERPLFSFPDQQELHRSAAIVKRGCLCAVEAGCHPEEEHCKDVREDGSHVGAFKTSANADTSYGEKTTELDRTDLWYYTDTTFTIEFWSRLKYISVYCLICIYNYSIFGAVDALIWISPNQATFIVDPMSTYKIFEKYSFSPQPCDKPLTNFLKVLWK